jgi:chemotaxis protein methyltransferase WspC
MTLLEAGLAPDQFSIDAVDISETSLAAAKRASYGGNSFRGEKEGAREMWFKPEAGRWQLDTRVRAQVTFHHSNLFAYAPGVRYDFVFCRNLLIYFDAAEQSAAARSLLQLLMEDGVLFVGHAESAVMLREGLAVLPEPRAFAFTRKPAEVAKPVNPAVVRKAVPVTPPARPVAKVVPRAPAPATKPAAPSLEGIKELADRGRLVEAAGMARAHVEAQGASAEGLHLLAIIEDARGDTAAAEAAYRKVLYLDPKHDEAITHLALLLERRGDPEAMRLWRRVKRPTAPGGKA